MRKQTAAKSRNETVLVGSDLKELGLVDATQNFVIDGCPNILGDHRDY